MLAVGSAAAWLMMDRSNGRLVSQGEKRKYLLYVPPSVQPGQPVPLVISIHGFASWPQQQSQISGWNKLADEFGFIVVYPMGIDYPRRWRIRAEAGTTEDPQIEVKFISDLIDKLQTQYNIDPARIYANGLSNGGGMSHVLACELSDRIAAVGSVAGSYLYAHERCHPARPVPLIAFHGTADPIVPYLGGRARTFDIEFPAVPGWMQAYAAQNGCSAVPEVLPAQGQVGGLHYSGCAQGADVIFYTIQDGGHTWPGGEALPRFITGVTNTDVNATRLMWNFFSEHPLVK